MGLAPDHVINKRGTTQRQSCEDVRIAGDPEITVRRPLYPLVSPQMTNLPLLLVKYRASEKTSKCPCLTLTLIRVNKRSQIIRNGHVGG